MELIQKGKIHLHNNEVKEAKDSFLEAAMLALNLAKSATNSATKKRFIEVADGLTKWVEEITPKKIEEQATQEIVNNEIKKSEDSDNIVLYMLMRKTGTPVISHYFESQSQINDMLFSSAVSAIMTMLGEAVNDDLSEISFSNLHVDLEKFDDLISLLMSREYQEDIKGMHKSLIQKIKQQYMNQLNEAIEQNAMLSDQEVESIISSTITQSKIETM